MVLSEKIKLDENGFITDHKNIDAMIQKLSLTGSCEQMHHAICKAYRAFYERKGLKLLAARCTIKVVVSPPDEEVAHIDYVYISPTATPRAIAMLSVQ